MKKILRASFAFAIMLSTTAQAQSEVTSFVVNGQRMVITQSPQINTAALAAFAESSENCTGLCKNALQVDRQVAKVGEIELIKFLTAQVEDGSGLLIDARIPRERQVGFIVSSVNVPTQTVAPTNPFSAQILAALGGVPQGNGYDFSNAYDLMIYDSGPGSEQAQQLVALLIDANFPMEKLAYYRGGTQVWAGLGLSFVEPQS